MFKIIISLLKNDNTQVHKYGGQCCKCHPYIYVLLLVPRVKYVVQALSPFCAPTLNAHPPPPPRVLFLLEEADSKYVICFLSLPHLPVPSFPLFHCLLVRLPFLPFVGVPLSVMPSPSSLCLTVTQPHTQTGCLCVTFCLLSPVTFSSSFQLPFPSHTVLY